MELAELLLYLGFLQHSSLVRSYDGWAPLPQLRNTVNRDRLLWGIVLGFICSFLLVTRKSYTGEVWCGYPHLACPLKNANRRHCKHASTKQGEGRKTLEGLGIKAMTSKITEPSPCTRHCVD